MGFVYKKASNYFFLLQINSCKFTKHIHKFKKISDIQNKIRFDMANLNDMQL